MTISIGKNFSPRQFDRFSRMLTMASSQKERTGLVKRGEWDDGYSEATSGRVYTAINCRNGLIVARACTWQNYNNETVRGSGHSFYEREEILYDSDGLVFRELMPMNLAHKYGEYRTGTRRNFVQITRDTTQLELDRIVVEGDLWAKFRGRSLFNGPFQGGYLDDSGFANIWFQNGAVINNRDGNFDLVSARKLQGSNEVIEGKGLRFVEESSREVKEGKPLRGKLKIDQMQDGRRLTIVKLSYEDDSVDRIMYDGKLKNDNGFVLTFEAESDLVPDLTVDLEKDWVLITPLRDNSSPRRPRSRNDDGQRPVQARTRRRRFG